MDPCSNITLNKREVSSLTIILENPLKAYFAGETVRGTVKFEAHENEIVQVLSVCLRGEFYYTKDNEEYVEHIFVETSPVDYRGAGEGNIELEFSLVLRPNFSSSMVSPLGGIKYRVYSTLVYRKDEKMDCVAGSELISVNCPKQLGEDAGGRRVSSIERGGILCCIGSISAQADISRVFLLCGWSVIVNASIFNGTHSSVQTTIISIVQIVERQRDGKKVKRAAASKQRGAILPGKRQVWLSETLLVPPLPPTSADPFFKTSYKFVMEIQKVSGKPMKLKIPIVIGNVAATEVTLPSSSMSETGSRIEWMCSCFPDETEQFKPLYVTYS